MCSFYAGELAAVIIHQNCPVCIAVCNAILYSGWHTPEFGASYEEPWRNLDEIILSAALDKVWMLRYIAIAGAAGAG